MDGPGFLFSPRLSLPLPLPTCETTSETCVLYFFETLQQASQPVSTAQQRFHISVLSFKSLVALFPQCCFYTQRWGEILKKTSEGVEFLQEWERWKEEDCENASKC